MKICSNFSFAQSRLAWLFSSYSTGLVIAGLTLISVGSLGTGCSSTPTAQPEPDPTVLYKEAEEDFKHDHFQIAIEKFRIVKNRFPYSKVAVDAALRIGDVLFEQELFGDAALAYENFRDLHPKNERTPYAMFRIGKSYLNDTPRPVSRDIASATKAADAFGQLIRRFPDAKETQDAKVDLLDARNLLAEKEIYIGDFYVRAKETGAAKPRYQKVIDQFGDTPSAKIAQSKLEKITPSQPK